MPTPAQAGLLRQGLERIFELLASELRILFRPLDSGEAARQALLDLGPQLYRVYGSAAATLSADWYDEVRETDGVSGRYQAVPAEADPEAAGLEELGDWGLRLVIAGDPEDLTVADWESATSLVAGGMERRVANLSRDTLADSALADPAADGWQRIGEGACAFCSMLISRGTVYTERTADFASHDNCRCSVAPAWGGRPRLVKPYTPSTKNISDAERARVREYLRTH